ncbi:MAG: hypothetical protein JSU64_00480 [candidate division WOR-3 bacterium]|nr:MAG: hypothetical protein JSU64_00480 [candidate division WOR-3 bacterium]
MKGGMVEKKFRTLRTITIILKIIAWTIAALTIIGFIAILVGGAALAQFGGRFGGFGALGPFGAVGVAFYVLIIGIIWFISLLAGAELILVILAIEEHTRPRDAS